MPASTSSASRRAPVPSLSSSGSKRFHCFPPAEPVTATDSDRDHGSRERREDSQDRDSGLAGSPHAGLATGGAYCTRHRRRRFSGPPHAHNRRWSPGSAATAEPAWRSTSTGSSCTVTRSFTLAAAQRALARRSRRARQLRALPPTSPGLDTWRQARDRRLRTTWTTTQGMVPQLFQQSGSVRRFPAGQEAAECRV